MSSYRVTRPRMPRIRWQDSRETTKPWRRWMNCPFSACLLARVLVRQVSLITSYRGSINNFIVQLFPLTIQIISFYIFVASGNIHECHFAGNVLKAHQNCRPALLRYTYFAYCSKFEQVKLTLVYRPPGPGSILLSSGDSLEYHSSSRFLLRSLTC